ncbi:Na(+) H(+) antiporter subunit D [hydrothermal vent metagenome]|uniref:Na(+) H(+) antiporter subunit D n=1 Tax=hydrothermal vent metagenome TaxID=652676 RepID=A0A3B1A0I3_9ZZZZ
MISHLPILQVIIPLLASPLCLILKHARVVSIFATFVSALSMIISILLLQDVLENGVISYQLGDWKSTWGIEYRIDQLNAYLLVLISSISTIVLVYANKSIQREIPRDRQIFFYIAYLLCLTGLLGICATGDVFNVFVFLEISSLSSYTLISLGKDRRALLASYQYLIMGTIGATFILIGIGLMYVMTGTLNMHDLSERLPNVADTRTIYSAFAFFLVGVCLKLALFPLHYWLPNAYCYAPSAVTAFLAATATKVAIYILIRFSFSVFGVEFAFNTIPLQNILLTLGLLGIFSASITAIYQTNVKRLFAYSSIAQIAYMILAFSMHSATGLMAMLIHLFNHALMKGALFLALGAVVYKVGSVDIKDFHGLGKKMPWTMAAIVIAGFSLIGVPLTAGFISKWYLVLAAFENSWWPVVLLILLGSLLALIYVWRIIEAAYFTVEDIDNNKPIITSEAPLQLLVPIWILVIANIYFGIDTRYTVGLTRLISQTLFGVTS